MKNKQKTNKQTTEAYKTISNQFSSSTLQFIHYTIPSFNEVHQLKTRIKYV